MMNRYQKALKVLCENIDCANNMYLDSLISENLEIISELVDKATPKTVVPKWKDGYDPELYYPDSFYCPSCDRKLRIDQFYKWCPDCNQKLNRYVSKWELEND